MNNPRFLLVMGTRPEVIKLAPVYFALREAGAEVVIINTNQQPELTQQALDIFDLEYHHNIRPSVYHSLKERLAHLIIYLPMQYKDYNPDFVIVQGDTTSALAGAISAFYEGVKVAHVEAGLSSGDLTSPFPEEGHRRMISQIASFNFAPTYTAKANLQELGASNYHVVGNTVVDALNLIETKHPGINGHYVLITLHRRESFGERLRGMLEAIGNLAEKYQDVKFILSVHPNPNVRKAVYYILNTVNIDLLDPPPDYDRWVNLMRGAYFIMTDSGGIQEEAPSFGVPVLVLRDKTERWESIHLGYSRLVGTDPERIFKAASGLLNDEKAREAMVAKSNPYGDGQAGKRIAEILMEAVIERERILQAV
jgi:UDP-N-acetylglucosamine 2-epimerase (non-hydrolysing)